MLEILRESRIYYRNYVNWRYQNGTDNAPCEISQYLEAVRFVIKTFDQNLCTTHIEEHVKITGQMVIQNTNIALHWSIYTKTIKPDVLLAV